jgi:hypothetical protein
MTNEEREVIELTLEAHKKNERHNTVAETRYWCNQYKLLAHQAIEALAQPEQEPVAYTNGTDVILAKHWTADYPPEGWEPLGYTTPPQRKPLTYGQILAANYPDGEENGPTIAAPDFELICFARQIEAAHGISELNQGLETPCDLRGRSTPK